jgi:hypothetical protein
MPTFASPNTDLDREGFLVRALETGRGDLAAGHDYVTAGTLNSVEAFLSDFRPMVRAATEKLSGRSKESREAGAAVEKVSVYCRDMWEGIKRRAAREGLPAEVLTFYGLPLNGVVPKPGGREAWMALAEQIVAGDAKAAAAGYAPMANPGAAELAAVIQAARTEQAEVAAADREYDAAQAKVESMRARADELVDDVMAELRFRLRKLEAASQRRVMRTYGARYTYLKGEPADADEAPAATAG